MSEEYLTVSALTKYLKYKFDKDPYLDRVYLTGEISNFRLRPTHQYFSLKDQHAIISATMFQSAFKKVNFQLEEGMKVLVIGRITIFEKSGQYQINIEHMEPDGIGALYQAYEQLKKRLSEEGLFNLPKKAIPRFPKKIAILTSESGAVIRDIQTTIQRRFPIVQLVLYPTVVQGAQAVGSILKNLDLAESQDYDVMIVGRGGGSIEDLWAFNDEAIVRKVAQLSTPLISSVGHETDTTLIDLVADMRAATPTAAAELATPVLAELYQTLASFNTRLRQVILQQLLLKQERVTRLIQAPILKKPERLYEAYQQNLDQLSLQLRQTVGQYLNSQSQQFIQLRHRLELRSPQVRVKTAMQQWRYLNQQLIKNQQYYLHHRRQLFQQLAHQLDLLSPLKIMSRGYSLVEHQKVLVTSVEQLQVGDEASIKLSDGIVQTTVTKIEKG